MCVNFLGNEQRRTEKNVIDTFSIVIDSGARWDALALAHCAYILHVRSAAIHGFDAEFHAVEVLCL